MDVCRTCLSDDGLSSIFKDTDFARRSKDLYDVTGLKILLNDGLPQVICQQCLLLINGALKLRQQSALSEATLLQSGYKVKTQKDENEKFDEEKDYDSDFGVNNTLDDSGFVNNETEHKLEDDVDIPVSDLRKKKVKQDDEDKFSEDKRIYYNRNTPLNRMVTVKGDTYNVKVEIGNVVWESEVKKGKKSLSNLIKNKYKKDSKLKKYLKHNRGKIKSKKCKDELITKEECESDYTDCDNDVGKEKVAKGDKDEDIGLFDHLLLRKRRTMTKEKLESFTALAVTPYDKKGPVKCKVCHKELMNFRNFLNHCKIHFAAENTCETCGKEFVNRNSMRYHQMRLHGAEKMHKCKYCDYKGVDVYQMKNHERRVHTGEKPFICNECGVSFYLRAGIAQHMRKHFAVKSIQCDRCPAMFRSRNELTTHRNKVHLMHYTYYCYMCPEKYRAIGTVRKHLARRHGVPKEQQMNIPVSKIRKSNEIAEGLHSVEWSNEMQRHTMQPDYIPM